ncbi:coiled-coil domain-containing protein 34-like [Neocloeon triangulifer]|uniref:coiled-coil domain-containing protein 34-like n=1 Tax=Neocloeon triangulifer TaxID=2078957 RepID=UPI00286F49F4|nr:coiled-coil domain-containing protein 34-like [Neocloeon triangulifer]
MMQIEEEKKRRDAKRTYAQWYQTKEQERKSKSNKDEGKSERLAEMKKEAGERRKKLGYNLEWREWCRLKKQQSLPKRFTYHEYPEPTWTNPDPWVD